MMLRLTFCIGMILIASLASAAKPGGQQIPTTGKVDPAMQSYDLMISALMAKWKIPGGSVAVTRNGRLVYARGFGWADMEKKTPVGPDSLFRIASISKPITSAVILRLVELKKLSLDDKAFGLLGNPRPPYDATTDPRLGQITIRQLLQHSGGWDRDKSFDAMFIPTKAAKALGEPAPAGAATVIRYMLGQPLDFDPGGRYAYSNLGYAILGRVIERVTGKTYAEATEQLVLRPAGIKRMRLGRTLAEFRAPNEVHYYHHTHSEPADPVFLYLDGKVPWPYGGFHLEAMDAHGAWIASATDLVRFATAIDGTRGRPIINSQSRESLVARPGYLREDDPATHYGLGWNVRPVGDDTNWWHTGSLPGTTTLLVRAHNGMTWAVLFNMCPEEGGKFKAEFDQGMWKAAEQVSKWPGYDLFEK